MKGIITIPKVPTNAVDVFRLLPEGTRAEVLNNVLYMSPSPFFEHQQLIVLMVLQLGNHIKGNKLGELIAAPFDVYLEEQMSAVQPDVLFISNKNKKILKDDGYAHGAPDLIIEILSKDEDRDRKMKKDIYEKAGVKEYFIIDPKTKMTEAYFLKGKKYEQKYRQEKYFHSPLLNLEFSF
ncbi:MAG: Uma2 family endonuclease [Chitinophagaceae bacterium]